MCVTEKRNKINVTGDALFNEFSCFKNYVTLNKLKEWEICENMLEINGLKYLSFFKIIPYNLKIFQKLLNLHCVCHTQMSQQKESFKS